jgi:hypothetical protein
VRTPVGVVVIDVEAFLDATVNISFAAAHDGTSKFGWFGFESKGFILRKKFLNLFCVKILVKWNKIDGKWIFFLHAHLLSHKWLC